MKVSDFRQLGMLPLQDHRDILPEFRASVQCGRIVDRDPFGRWQVEGHQESESDVQTLGDLLGGFFLEQESTAERQQGAWFFTGPCVTTESSTRKRERSNIGQNQTRTRAEQNEADKRTVKVRPVACLEWDADGRFKEFEVRLHPDTPNLPSGSPLVVLPTTAEDKQELLGFPAANNVLIAANEAGDPTLSSIVYDLTDEDKIDQKRSAFLHTFWRIAKLGGGCNLGSNDALVWQLGRSGLDKLDGRGLVMDRSGVPAQKSPSAPQPGSVEAQDGRSGTAQYGAVVSAADLLRDIYDNLARARANQPTGTGGAVFVVGGGGDSTRTRERPPPEQTRTRIQPKSDPTQVRPPASQKTGTRSDVLASMSAHSSGPIDVGDNNDVHRIGTTRDGLIVNAAHLSCTSLWRNKIGDGPLDFESTEWEDPVFGGPFLSPVHLRWDPGVTHEWACGSAPGRWRWAAENFFFIPGGQTTTLPRHPPEDGDPTLEPPPECQNLPGGGGNQQDGPGLAVGEFDFSGAPTGTAIVVTGGGTGQDGLSNTDGAAVIPGGDPLVDGPTDVTVGGESWDWLHGRDLWRAINGVYTPPSDGSAARTVSSAQTGEATSSETGEATSSETAEITAPGPFGDHDLLGSSTNSGGGMVPGSEPRRPEQKSGSGSSTGTAKGATTGNSRFDFSGAQTVDAIVNQNFEFNRMPIGGMSVFGGGNLPPTTHIALFNEGTIDQWGRPSEIPPPRVGDGLVRRREQLGGVDSRQPTAAQTMGFGGGVNFRAAATAAGQVDFTRGGWIQNEISLLADAGRVGAMVGFGLGNGTWEDLEAPESQESISGGVIFGPSEVTQPENLQRLFNGDFHFDSAFANTALGTETRLYMPGGLAQLYFAHPDAAATTGVTGGGGVRMAHTSVGLEFVALTGTGADSPIDLLFGEGGLNLDGNMDIDGNLDVSGKLKVGGSIDPTDVQLTDLNGAASTIPALAAGLEFDATVDALRPLWTDTTGTRGALALLTDTVGAAAGSEVQSTPFTQSAVVSCTGGWAFDTSIPQISEGTEIISGSFTPTSLSNFIEIEFSAWGELTAANTTASVALFRDAITDAIHTTVGTSAGADDKCQVYFRHLFAVPSLSAQTYRIRGGSFSGTWHVNGNGVGTLMLGGNVGSYLRIREVRP